MPSSRLYLTLALFSNSVSINNQRDNDGEEPSVRTSEPFSLVPTEEHRREENPNILGRFVQVDPVRECPGHTHSPEMHLFVPNKSRLKKIIQVTSLLLFAFQGQETPFRAIYFNTIIFPLSFETQALL